MGVQNRNNRHDDALLEFSTKASVIILFVCILISAALSMVVVWKLTFGTYLEDVKDYTPIQLSSFNITLQLALYFIAIFIGMAFSCLGFALFLVNARGRLSIAADAGTPAETGNVSAYRGSVEASAPGLVAMVCATLIICISITRDWNASFPSASPLTEGTESSPQLTGGQEQESVSNGHAKSIPNVSKEVNFIIPDKQAALPSSRNDPSKNSPDSNETRMPEE